jgi:multidrug resistance protein
MLAPAEEKISKSLGVTEPYQWVLINSLILIGIGLSPLLLAPLSEVYGRKPVLIVGSVIFAAWNAGCGAATTLAQILAFRLLSGFGASVADALAGGLIVDMWRAEERGRAWALFMMAPLLGPAIGPICGAFISEDVSWRWVFWAVSIATACVIVAAIVALPETYEPRLQQLALRRAEAQQSVDRSRITNIGPYLRRFIDLMRINLVRPARMLGTQIIIQLLAVYMALLYGTMFLFLFMYPRMWTERYRQSVKIGSLNYLSFGIGLIGGVITAGIMNDHIYLRLKSKNNGQGRPEFRIPTMIMGTALVPVGLLWWGWSSNLHWIMPNIGSAIFAMGVYVCSSCISVYTMDTYTRYAASAISTNLILRSLTAAVFPLFAPYMLDHLGFGLGSTVLAGSFLIVGTTVMFVLWFRGESLRARSIYCAEQ